MRNALVLGVLGLAGTVASPAFADDFSGFRFGTHLNQDQLEGDFAFQGRGVQPVNENRFGYGLFGGWALNRYFAGADRAARTRSFWAPTFCWPARSASRSSSCE